MSDNKVVLMFNVKQPDDLYKIAIAGIELDDDDYAILEGPNTESQQNLVESIKQRMIDVPGTDIDDCSVFLPNPGESFDELVERIKDLAMALNPKVLKH